MQVQMVQTKSQDTRKLFIMVGTILLSMVPAINISSVITAMAYFVHVYVCIFP